MDLHSFEAGSQMFLELRIGGQTEAETESLRLNYASSLSCCHEEFDLPVRCSASRENIDQKTKTETVYYW